MPSANAASSASLRPVPSDLWGGLAAMLVAFPSAIAYGVLVYAPLGASFAAVGAIAGIMGAIILGIVAPSSGGTWDSSAPPKDRRPARRHHAAPPRLQP